MSGWLAGLPAAAGPILYILALEQGAAFAATAAAASLAAVLASVSFSVAYAWMCQRHSWPVAVAFGLAAWLLAALFLSIVEAAVLTAALLALSTLVVAPRVFPAVAVPSPARIGAGSPDLVLRMLAGATLTICVTLAAPHVGRYWSGLLAVFPVLGVVLAVFSHRTQGHVFAAALVVQSLTKRCLAPPSASCRSC